MLRGMQGLCSLNTLRHMTIIGRDRGMSCAVTENTLDSHGRRLRGSDGKGGFIYGDLKDAVAIDWNADVEAIAPWDWDEATLRVVTRSDGRDFYFVWENPKTMVWKYLRDHARGQSAPNRTPVSNRTWCQRRLRSRRPIRPDPVKGSFFESFATDVQRLPAAYLSSLRGILNFTLVAMFFLSTAIPMS
jgi:hypothetical protein